MILPFWAYPPSSVSLLRVEVTSAMLHWPRAMYLQRAMRPSRHHPSMVGQNALLAVETRSVQVWYKFRGAVDDFWVFPKHFFVFF